MAQAQTSVSKPPTTPANQRLRLGFFSYVQGEGPLADVYARTLDLFQAADDLGFDTGWVAQHHFNHHGGLPSPLVYFAALAERTRRIHLGTAVLTLPLEHPIRLAEDAAVFEAIHPGRLELGLGTGFPQAAIMAPFGAHPDDRHALYNERIARLRDAFGGAPLNDAGDTLQPPAADLLDRIWESPGSPPRVAEAAARGSGLMLSRVAIGAGDRPSHEIQIPLVDTYRASLPNDVAPRVALSRSIYPAHDPAIAWHDLTAGIAEMRREGVSHVPPTPEPTRELEFRKNNIHAGSTEDVVATLQREPLVAAGHVTDLICQLQPGAPSHRHTLEALELIARDVAPALGWSRATS